MTFRGSLQSAQQVRQSMKEWASYPYWWHFVASVTIISFMVCLFWLPNNVNKAANVCASVAVRFMLKMMDLDDVTVEQCSRVTSSRWSFIFQVKVWPQVISSSSVVDNALKTCAANLRFFVFMALSTTEVTCVTLRLSKKWDPALLRPLLTGVLQGMHLDRIPLSGCPRTDTCWLWILEPHLGQLRCTDSQSAVAQTGQRCKVQVPGTVGANGRSSAYFRTLQQKFASTNNKQLTGQKLACQLLVVCACILLLNPWGEPCDPFLRHSFLPPSCKLEGRNLCFIRSLHTFAASAQVVQFYWMSCVSLLIASIHTQ